MSCYTQEEIAELLNCTRDEVRAASNDFGEFGKLAEIPNEKSNHLTDFAPPIYNVWKFKDRTAGISPYRIQTRSVYL